MLQYYLKGITVNIQQLYIIAKALLWTYQCILLFLVGIFDNLYQNILLANSLSYIKCIIRILSHKKTSIVIVLPFVFFPAWQSMRFQRVREDPLHVLLFPEALLPSAQVHQYVVEGLFITVLIKFHNSPYVPTQLLMWYFYSKLLYS